MNPQEIETEDIPQDGVSEEITQDSLTITPGEVF